MTTIFHLPEHLLTAILCSWLDVRSLFRLDTAFTSRAMRPKYLACIVRDTIDMSKLSRCSKHGRREFYSSCCDVSSLVMLDWFTTRNPNKSRISLKLEILSTPIGARDTAMITQKFMEGEAYAQTVDLFIEGMFRKDTTRLNVLSNTLTLLPHIANLHLDVNFDLKDFINFLNIMISRYDALTPSLESLNLTFHGIYGMKELSDKPEVNAVIDTFFRLYGNYIRFLEYTIFYRSIYYILEQCPNLQFIKLIEFPPGCWDNVNKVTKLVNVITDKSISDVPIPVSKLHFFPDLEEYISCENEYYGNGRNTVEIIKDFLRILKSCRKIKHVRLPGIDWNSLEIYPQFSIEKWDFSKNMTIVTDLLEILSLIPKLRALSIEYLSYSDFEFAVTIWTQTKHARSLVSFNMSRWVEWVLMTDEADSFAPFVSILRNFPSIRAFELDHVRWLASNDNEFGKGFIEDSDEDQPNLLSLSSLIEVKRDTLFRTENSKRDFVEFLALIPPIWSFKLCFMDSFFMDLIQKDNAFRHLEKMDLTAGNGELSVGQTLTLFLSTLQNSTKMSIFFSHCLNWNKTNRKDNAECETADSYSDLSLMGDFDLDESTVQTFTQAMALISPIQSLSSNQKKEEMSSYWTMLNSILTSTGHTFHITKLSIGCITSWQYLELIVSSYPVVRVFSTWHINSLSAASLLKVLVQSYPDIERVWFSLGEWRKQFENDEDIPHSMLRLNHTFTLKSSAEKEDFVFFLQNIPAIKKLNIPSQPAFDAQTLANLTAAFALTQNEESLMTLMTMKLLGK